MASIEIHDIYKSYGAIEALKAFDLRIDDGEFVVLVGPSGCGKSTMLKILAGLEPATSGRIVIGDREVTDLAPGERDVAMVFQNYALYPHLSVRKNMGFGLKMRGMQKSQIDAKVEEAARILGLEALLERRPKMLSGGQRQRVALGRAIVREPQAFLMDEPLSNLDAKLRVQMRAEIGELHKRIGTTTVYVTHDQTEAMTMAHRIVIMRDGEIQQIADPDTMFLKPVNRFVAGFIGSPGMNFQRSALLSGDSLSVRVFGKDIEIRNPGKALGMAVGKEVIIGIRPEHIGFAEGPFEFEVTAKLVESLGSEKYIYFSVDNGLPIDRQPDDSGDGQRGTTFVARVSHFGPLRIGEKVQLSIDPSKFYFFDAESQAAIR